MKSKISLSSNMASGIALAILASFSFALTGFVANRLADQGYSGIVIGFYESLLGLTLVVGINIKHLRSSRKVSYSTAVWIILAALGFALAFGSFYTALNSIDYSIGAPILGAVPLVSYAVILIVLRGQERVTRRALLGSLFVVSGVTIIGVAS